MEQCLSLISVIKDRWDASSSFLEEKETIFRAFNTLEPILRDASRASATASAQHTEALKGVLDVLQGQLKDLRDVFVYCEKNTIWTTWMFPNKHKAKLVKLISNIQSYLPMLTISISTMINETTKEIKEDTTKIKDTTSDTNAIAKKLQAQMEDMKRLFGGEVNSKKLQEIQTQVVEEKKEVTAEEMEKLLHSAQDLEKKGRYKDGLLEFVKYYAILQKQGKEKDDLKTATFYYELGEANRNQGQYPKAIEFHLKALDIRLKKLDKNDVKISNCYNELGLVYDSQGNYPKALEYYEKCLAIRLKTLGAEHPNVATSYNNLGIVYKAQGDYPKALEYYEKDLAISLKTLGAEHPDVATSYNNLGSVYWKQGDYSKAIEYYEKSLAIRLKTLGAEHPNVANTYNNLGSVYDSQGNHSKALEYFEKSLAIRLKTLGAEHPSTKNTQQWITNTRNKINAQGK